MTGRFVLDCSLAMSWCIEGEQTPATEAMLDSLATGSAALVPVLWVWEINNVLLTAQKEGRLDSAKRSQQAAILKLLPIKIDTQGYQQTWNETFHLALAYNLTIYDASYLELALREGLPLGTLDKSLRQAARKAGASCLPEKVTRKA